MIDIAAGSILANLKPEQVRSAYEGRAGKCACGCSGTYWGPAYIEPGNDPEVERTINEANVVRILAKVQRRGAKASTGEVEPLWTATYADGSRMWAYQTKTQLIRIESTDDWVANGTN